MYLYSFINIEKRVSVDIRITSDYITLGQFIKFIGVIGNGAEAKPYLSNHQAYINGELDTRRGRKIYPGDVVEIEKKKYKVIT